MIKLRRINLKKLVKPMVFFQINLKKIIMTILVMLLLKMEVVAKAGLEVLEDLVEQIFLIFLKIFLVTLEVGGELLETEIPIIEARI